VFKLATFAICTVILCCRTAARADEPTRQVQEELRKRHLFYGDIDGRPGASLAMALKRYQERKGFAQTGIADGDTLRSMGIASNDVPEVLPDVPVLRSDRGLPEGLRNTDGMSFVSVAPAVKGPPPTRAEIRSYIRRYLDAAQTPDVEDETAFYGERVQYLDHGNVTRPYIRNELVVYQQHWPLQQYTLGDTVTLNKVGDKTRARVRIAFNVANPALNRKAVGKVDSTFLLARQPDSNWQIVGIQEARVRERSSRHRSRPSPVENTMRKLQRSMRKFFR
jgi:peptidoglycan hydrolase-like protein with peptidoglycan-binding domain